MNNKNIVKDETVKHNLTLLTGFFIHTYNI